MPTPPGAINTLAASTLFRFCPSVVCLGLLRGLVQATFKRMQAERVVQAQAQRALLRQSQLPPVDPNRGLGLAMYQAELAERAAMENQKTETPLVIATQSVFGSSLSCAWCCANQKPTKSPRNTSCGWSR